LTALVALAAPTVLPGLRLRDLLRTRLSRAVRRWYPSVTALAVLAPLAGVVVPSPATGLGFAPAPLLFVDRGGSRVALRPVVLDGAPPTPPLASVPP
ncbi:hypothetical protein V5O49_00100, partial [Isoptericola sp. MSP01]